MSQLGIALKAARLGARLSLHRLGARLDVSPAWLCDVEAGRRHPSLERVHQLGQALRVSVDELVRLWVDAADTAATRAYRAGFEAGRKSRPRTGGHGQYTPASSKPRPAPAPFHAGPPAPVETDPPCSRCGKATCCGCGSVGGH